MYFSGGHNKARVASEKGQSQMLQKEIYFNGNEKATKIQLCYVSI